MKYNPEKFFNKISDTYAGARHDDSYLPAEWDVIRNHLAKTDHILDLCCGAGTFLIPLNNEGYNVEGIDISNNMIRHALKQDKSITIAKDDATRLQKSENTYECIIMMGDSIGVIPEEKSRKAILGECYRVLKKSGKLILTAGNRNSSLHLNLLTLSNYVTRLFRGKSYPYGTIKYTYDGNSAQHYNYSVDELNKKLKSIGFKILERKTSYHKQIIVAVK